MYIISENLLVEAGGKAMAKVDEEFLQYCKDWASFHAPRGHQFIPHQGKR